MYLFFVVFVGALPFIFNLTKNWKFDRYIGELSYPIYISHIFILACISASQIPTFGQQGLIVSIATIIFAIILNELVSKKIENIRQKRVKQNR